MVSVAALLAGCAVGPDFERPEAPKNAGYTPQPLPPDISSVAPSLPGGQAQHFTNGADVPFEWWKQFNSPALNSLVEKSFRGNPTLPAALAALRQAQEQVYAQEGFFFPTIGGGYSFERQQLPGNQSSNAPGQQGNGTSINSTPQKPAIYNTHTSTLSLSFVPDVFGGNIRAVEALNAQVEIQRYSLHAAYVTLASNVVAAAINEASLRAQIDATKKIIAFNTTLLDILKEQFKNGLVMRMDVAAQEAALAQAKQLLPPLEKEFQQNRDLIRVLVGNTPNEDVPETFDFASLTLPKDLPLSLPSKVIQLRPDVRAAEEAIRAANAQVGIAIANRLPQFSITGAQGGTATTFAQMFATGGPFWNIIGGFTQTIFDGNTLLHRERAADQALLQAAAQYRSTVLSAYQNVSDTLYALDSDANALSAAVESEHAAKITLDLTQEQLKSGFVPPATLLLAQQAYEQALLSLVQAQAARYDDTATFYTVLGGGWWNRTDLAMDDQKNDFFLEWFEGMVSKWDEVKAR